MVILDPVNYITKVESLLSDASKFKKFGTEILDLCLKRENKLIRFLRDTLLKKKIITENTYNSLYQNGSSSGVLYDLPKVHKSDSPATAILSAIAAHNYKLAKLFVPILQPYASNEFIVKDSFSFASEITPFTDNKRYYYLKICDLDVCLYLKLERKCFGHEIPYLGVLSSFTVRLLSCVS